LLNKEPEYVHLKLSNKDRMDAASSAECERIIQGGLTRNYNGYIFSWLISRSKPSAYNTTLTDELHEPPLMLPNI